MRKVIFQLPKSWLGPSGEGLMPFYTRLQTGLEASGVTVEHRALDRATVLAQVENDDNFHLINHGRFRHPRILNAGVAYIYPFWNVDPWGIRAFSSIAADRFDPAALDGPTAQAFFRKLRQRLVQERTSRYPQPEPRASDLPQDAVAVFLQSEAHRDVDEACYLDRQTMLDTVLAHAPGPVIVKPHPRDVDPATKDWLADRAARHPALTVSTANIHDILTVAERVVTINSAVGIETYLHRRPLILCGQADFHHIARTARSPDALATALAEPPKRRSYDKYIYWYFGQHCFSTTEPDLAGRYLARAEAVLSAGPDPTS